MSVTIIIILLVVTVALLVFGIIGCIVPGLPGPLLTYAGVITYQIASPPEDDFSWTFLIVWGLIVAAVAAGDALLPAYATKKAGGTKAGIWGGIIGTLIGLFFPPWGLILGPLLGAIIGDLYGGKQFENALKSGFASFVGFLLSTLSKLVVSVVLGLWICIKAVPMIIGLF